MSECKHDGKWRLQGNDNLSFDVVCENCGAKIRDVLESKDRQLEVAAEEVAGIAEDDDFCASCLVMDECGGTLSDCAAACRKRWEEESNGQNGNHQAGC